MNARGRALLEIEDFTRNRGRFWPDLWPEVSRDAVRQAVEAALTGETARFRAYCPTARGVARWWDSVVSPVCNPRTGEMIGLLATSHDVTVELDTTAFLDAVIENVPAVIFVKDAVDGRFLLINRAAGGIFGLPREQMFGRTDFELFPQASAETWLRDDREVIAAGGAPVIVEDTTVREDGATRAFRTKKVATFGPEGPRHIVCMGEDISEERAAAAQLKAAVARAEAANSAKGEFLANMSHEIRTPLNGVVGVAEALGRTALTADQREMVELIQESGQTLERLLSDILDLARIEAGRVELESEAFDLAGSIRSVAALADLHCREKDIRLVVDIAPGAGVWVAGDVTRLKQVVTNLLSNAVKFTERGEVRIVLEPAQGGFRIEVADTGVGFDAEVREQIFARFQQADGSITRRFGGSGLGLAITRQLVELMGGTIDCASVPGEGSSFVVSVPLAVVEPPAYALAAPQDFAGVDRVRVLLADDHPTNRKVVELILAQAAVDLLSVADGRAAVDAFLSERFDVVLTDMQMPVMDGLTATRLIRDHERSASRARTPVVMLTANAQQDHVRASLEAGADRHMAKPISAAGLLTVIAELTTDPAEASRVVAG